MLFTYVELDIFCHKWQTNEFHSFGFGAGLESQCCFGNIVPSFLVGSRLHLASEDENLPLVRFTNAGSSHRVVSAIKNKAPLLWCFAFYGADYGARTRHLRLGKATLYQMS